MTDVRPARLEYALLRLWHAWLAGSFLVAWLTADEDTYAMHLFSGYAVLAAIGVRLLAGALVSRRSPWRLVRPDPAALLARVRAAVSGAGGRKGRHPLLAWFAAALLGMVGLSAVSGALAHGLTWLEDPHEALSEAALLVIIAHIAFVSALFGGRRMLARVGGWLHGRRSVANPREDTP